MPTRVIPKDANNPSGLTDEILSVEKGRGRVIQVVDNGTCWVLVYETAPKRETR